MFEQDAEAHDYALHAVVSGVLAAFSPKAPPAYLSQVFLASSASPDPVRPFPCDGPFLSAEEVDQLHHTAPDRWPLDRCHAHLDTDHPIARRASVSWFVWTQFRSRPQMTQAELRDWVELDLLTRALTPQSWAQHRAAAAGQSLETWWAEFTKTARADVVARHAATLQRLQTYA